MADIKQNLPSGLVVFLVALPLCLGIASASGAPPLLALFWDYRRSSYWLLSNSHISVWSHAGLAAIVLAGISDLGSFELFLVAGIIAGIIQLILGFVG